MHRSPQQWISLLAIAAALSSSWSSCSLSPSLEPVSSKEWQAALAGRRGRITVVLVWASWCLPCVDLFPELTQLAANYRDRGVEFTTLSLDDGRRPEELAAARRLVAEQNVPLAHYILQEEIAASLEELSLKDLPAVRVYNREGELRYQLEPEPPAGTLSVADLQDAIDSLL
jgi:thiol-disulfide isomerase/thioredoxin